MECEIYDIGCQFNWAIDEIELLFVKFYAWVIMGLAGLFADIPAPYFLSNVDSLTSGLTDDVIYYATLFKIQSGLQIIVSAYIARFVLRRIPGIG